MKWKTIIKNYGDDFRNLPSIEHFDIWRKLKNFEEILANFNEVSISITYKQDYGLNAPDILKTLYKFYVKSQIKELLKSSLIKEMLTYKSK